MASLRLSRAVLSTVAAGALTLAAITVALVVGTGTAGAASTATIDLKSVHENTTAEDFS